MLQQYLPFTVLKRISILVLGAQHTAVATVLTVYGIETLHLLFSNQILNEALQQYLPFTVLKLASSDSINAPIVIVATVLTVYGIETRHQKQIDDIDQDSCNSTYRLRY